MKPIAFDIKKDFSEITPTEKAVWLLLSHVSHVSFIDRFAVDIDNLSKIAGIAKTRLRSALWTLRDKGLICLEEGDIVSNVCYVFNDEGEVLDDEKSLRDYWRFIARINGEVFL